MYKYRHLVAAILIVIVIIILDIILENFTNKKIEAINKNLSEIEKIIQEDKYDDVTSKKMEDKYKAMIKKWDSSQKILSCYIEHDQIEKIDSKIKIIKTQIESKSYSDAIQTISETKLLVKYMQTKQDFTLENVF